MSSDMGAAFSRKASAIAEKYGLDVPGLEEDIFDAMTFARSWLPAEKKPIDQRASHPALAMCKRITGKPVPPVLWDEFIAFFGPTPDEDEYREAFRAWVENGKDPDNYTWRKWAKSKRRNWTDGRQQAQPAQQAPAGFQGLQEWLNGRS